VAVSSRFYPSTFHPARHGELAAAFAHSTVMIIHGQGVDKVAVDTNNVTNDEEGEDATSKKPNHFCKVFKLEFKKQHTKGQ